MENNKRVAIIGNSKLSKKICDLNKNLKFDLFPIKEILKNKKQTQKYQKIFYISQITRRILNDQTLIKYNREVTEFVRNLTFDMSEIIFVSSIDVYGSEEKYLSSSSSIKPFDYYSHSKAETEISVKDMAKRSIILRFPGLYGVDLKEKSVISRMLSSSIKDSLIKVSNPNIYRTFLSYNYAAKNIIFSNKIISQLDMKSHVVSPIADKGYNLGELAIFIRSLMRKRGYSSEIVIDKDSDTREGRVLKQYLIKSNKDAFNIEPENSSSSIEIFVDKITNML